MCHACVHCHNACSLVPLRSSCAHVCVHLHGRLTGGVVHSFDGSLEAAQALMEFGFYIGLNGCSLRQKENLEVVRQLPLDKIMLEV